MPEGSRRRDIRCGAFLSVIVATLALAGLASAQVREGTTATGDLLRRARGGTSGGVTVPGAGHLLNLDAPDRFNESLLAFLSR